jgi:hypothetical protein
MKKVTFNTLALDVVTGVYLMHLRANFVAETEVRYWAL